MFVVWLSVSGVDWLVLMVLLADSDVVVGCQ